MALQQIGAATITSTILEADSTDSARKINVVYNLVLDEVLSSGAWSTAKFDAELTRDLSTPLFDYSYQYHLPTDPFCLKVLRLNGAEGNKGVKYEVQNRLLLTDESTAKIKYIGRLTDAEIFGVYLTIAFAFKLAVTIVIPITKSRSLYDDLSERYEKIILPHCILRDNQQGSNPTYQYNSDIDAGRSHG